MELKQVILVRTDLKMSKGKTAAQASHASVECTLQSDADMVAQWKAQGMKKVVLKVQSIAELQKYKELAKKEGLTACMIADGGRTELVPGTVTCLGIGPDKEEKTPTGRFHLNR